MEKEKSWLRQLQPKVGNERRRVRHTMDMKLSNSSIVSRIAPGDMPGTSDNGVCSRHANKGHQWHDRLAARKLMPTAAGGTFDVSSPFPPPKLKKEKKDGKRQPS
jgi:hypothetical protein